MYEENLSKNSEIFEKWQNGRVYELLGVKYFQKAYLATVGKIALPNGKWINKTKRGFENFDFSTKLYETIHTVFGIAYACYDLNHYQSNESVKNLLGGCLINALINIYPIMLQRYNRARVENILDKRYGDRK